ncbi:AAA family ATPase [Lysobacter rhizosphaerae]
MSVSEITLKITPPRLQRTAIERARLMGFWDDVHERTAIQLFAPAGFGKTTVMLQWRRRWLESGAIVAWVTCDNADDPSRFVAALVHSVYNASGRICALSSQSDLDALTDLLAEIAQRGARTVIVIDEARHLPKATVRTCIQYLLSNAPANLSVVIGSRVTLPLHVADLAARGNFAMLTADDLRLRLDESIEILEKSLGSKLTLDERALVHEATEGWPVALQLSIATAERDDDPGSAVRSLSARRGHLREYFHESLLSRMPVQTVALLTRMAILDQFSEELCELVSGQPDGAAQLQIISQTPMVIVGEDTGWISLHPMARDFLLGRFEQLPKREQSELHTRVSHWYAQRERYHEAARHALAAGNCADLCRAIAVDAGRAGPDRRGAGLAGADSPGHARARFRIETGGRVRTRGDRPQHRSPDDRTRGHRRSGHVAGVPCRGRAGGGCHHHLCRPSRPAPGVADAVAADTARSRRASLRRFKP